MQQQKLLLLSGWGTCCAAWDQIIPVLQARYQINCIPPSWAPATRASHSLNDFAAWVEWLANDLSAPVNIVAWSFGGLPATQLAARCPELVDHIIYISSSAKFLADENAAGIDPVWFAKFNQDFSRRPFKMLQKFFTLTNYGDEHAEQATTLLRQACNVDQYDMQECAYALNHLGALDLSRQLTELNCSISFIHGENDAVLTLEAARQAAQQVNSELYVLPATGHAPHISHPQEVADLITRLIPG